MKLYGSQTSPFVRHCRIALNQGGHEYEFIEIDAAAAGEKSPTKKVPMLEADGMRLTDSSSILKYVREKSGGSFMPDLRDFELFCMTNTVMDSAINAFLLGKNGVTADTAGYIGRQNQRVESGLDELNTLVGNQEISMSDGITRLACLLDWGLFRNRFSIDSRDNLKSVLDIANADSFFTATAIPADA